MRPWLTITSCVVIALLVVVLVLMVAGPEAIIVSVILLAILIALLAWGFAHRGRRGDAPTYAPLRSTLFNTVLVTLLILYLLMVGIIEHGQRSEQWPASEGLPELDVQRARGAPWLDDRAYDSIRDALLEAGSAPGKGSGEVTITDPGMMAASSGLPAAATAGLTVRGWALGTAEMHGGQWRYVSWRTGPQRAVYYIYQPRTWPYAVLSYLLQLPFAILLLAPSAGVAAWYLNRRIVKPVQQVADASVVLAEGGTPIAVPTKAPRELSVMAHSFNRMANKLRRAQETERDFLLSVGHELKTPLTAIDGYAELLADDAVDPKQAAEVFGLESARLRRLIADLLDLARIGRSEFTVVGEPVDLALTSREVVGRFANLAETLGVALVADAAQPAPARGDPGRLLQVASNLVENALRATHIGGRVDVLARPGLLSVSDTGPGLTDEDLEHAFERFYLHRRYSDGPEVGTGLGLAIVKDLAQAMGGSVEVASEPGRGSSFSVRLPAP